VALDRALSLDGSISVRWDALDSTLNAESARPQPAGRKRRRASRADTIDALTRAMHQHLLAARDHAFSRKQRGQAPALLPRPTEQDLAALVGVSPATVHRCLKRDPNAKQLQVFWRIASDVDQLMEFRG
jgi:AraC-like DNA-binding protein